MKHRALAFATLLVLPSIAVAQRSQATRRTPLSEPDEMPTGPSLRARDVEDLNPFKALIDKKKDLKLSDEQVKALKASESSMKEQDAPLYRSIDSLVREMRPPLNPTTDFRVRSQLARAALMTTIDSIAVTYDEPIKSAIATLDAEQQAKATELVAQAKQEGNKTVREKLGGGRRGGRGG